MRFSTLAAIASTLFLSTTSASTCNPLTSSDCSPDPALGSSFLETFDDNLGSHFESLNKKGDITFSESDGLSLTINDRFDNPSIKSNFYIMFGHVEVVLKGAEGLGIVSSFYLQSDDLDEIDIEMFGGDPYQWQSNYFIKGNTATYDRGGYHDISNPLENYHTYTIDWTEDELTWSVDGAVIRTIPKDNAQGYPQSPMAIYAGIWAGGDPDNQPGTIAWAGGITDYSKAPFTMHIKSILVADYSSGKSYSYSDQSGTWESIKAEDGEVNGRYDQAQDDIKKLLSGQSVDSSKAPSSSTSSSSSSSSKSSSSSSSSSTSTTSTEDATTSSTKDAATSSTEDATTSSTEDSTTSTTSSSSSSSTLTTSSTKSSSTTSTSRSSIGPISISAPTGAGTTRVVFIGTTSIDSASAETESASNDANTSSARGSATTFISTVSSSSTTSSSVSVLVNENNAGIYQTTSTLGLFAFIGFLFI
ncbi:MAG: glycoside hydrolase family 16 protein [Asgard group archaeon]|nr:glycoside hydrolase family 16 protein [Asgard group archaeon]